MLNWLKRIGNKILDFFECSGDKAPALGGIVAAMGCSVCFPALASLGAAIGLGFLTQWENLFMFTLMPIFAWVALLINALGWFSHRQCHRSLIGAVGSVLILLSLYPWNKWTLYGGLALMVGAALWDLVSPAYRRCNSEGRETTETPVSASAI